MSVRSRFALLTVGRLLFGVAAIARALELMRNSTSLRPQVVPSLLVVLGVALISWGAVGARALRGRRGSDDAQLISNSISEIDRRAPSGLRPLWIGLFIVLVTFLSWTLVASFGTT